MAFRIQQLCAALQLYISWNYYTIITPIGINNGCRYNKLMFEWMGNINLDAFYIVSQIFALLSIVFELIATQQKKKARLLNMDLRKLH